MPSMLPKFTMRVSQEMLDKLRYIADDNFRTMNKELEMLIAKHIADYEREHGLIVVPEED